MGIELRLDPRCFRLHDGPRQFGLRADHRIELLPDLAGHAAWPFSADLAQILAFLLAKIQSRYQ